MAAVRNLQFVLSGKDKSASKALDKVGKKADGLSAKLSKVGRNAALGLAGGAAAAVGGLAAAMARGVQDAQAYQTLQLKTAAAIKSTGNVAGTSVKEIQRLSGELESLSGVDEELIINSQNVLLTFTKVRNELGKGNKVFDRATEAALNMSVALGQDMQSATVMIGKALNDPIKGIAAMSRAGVQFTKQQKDQIKTLVQSGRTLDAQKVILAELETQFGGVAKAAGQGLAGSIARAKDAFGDLFRNLATPLLPKITKWAEDFAVLVNNKVAPAIMRFIDQFERGVGRGGEFRAQLASLRDVAADLWPQVQKVAEKVGQFFGWLIKHPNLVKTAAAGLVLYWVAMKAAAFHTGVMAGLNLLGIATGVSAIGTASAVSAVGVRSFAAAISRVALALGALYLADKKLGTGVFAEIGGGIKKVAGGDIGGGLKDIFLGDLPFAGPKPAPRRGSSPAPAAAVRTGRGRRTRPRRPTATSAPPAT